MKMFHPGQTPRIFHFFWKKLFNDSGKKSFSRDIKGDELFIAD